MKKIYLALLLLCLVCGCATNDEVSPENEEEYINKDAAGSIVSESDVELQVDGNDIGTLSIALLRDSLFLTYSLDDDIIISDLKFHVAVSKESLPTVNGALDPESFSFTEKNFSMPLARVTGSSKYKGALFFSFFCKVFYVQSVSEDEEVSVKIERTHELEALSYFKANVSTEDTNEEFLAYCLQGDQSIDTSYVHEVKRLSSLSKNSSMLSATVDAPENLILVNWILNQDAEKWTRTDGKPSNGADRQMAIWELIEKTGNPTGANISGKFDPATVEKIVADALANGSEFKPRCGSKILRVLHKGPIGAVNSKGTFNSGDYANPDYQVTGIVDAIECVEPEHASWSSGEKYISGDMGTYFVMYRN